MRALVLLGAWAMLALAAHAQAPPKIWRIGVAFLGYSEEAVAKRSLPVQPPLEEGLREHGWIEGKNIQILYRTSPRDASGESLAVEQLLRLSVDVLVTFENATTEQAMRATRTVPIVALMDGGAASGVIASLSRPGGNITGLSAENPGGLATKRLALLKEVAGVKRVARVYLREPLRFGTAKELIPEYAEAARILDLDVFPVWAASPEELRTVFAELNRRGGVGISVMAFSRLPGREAMWDELLALVARHRIPAVYDVPRAVEQGGMMSYGVDFTVQARRLAYFVDRILRGAKPADLPVEQPASASLVINRKAIESIGLKIPASIQLQADRIIP